MAADKEDPEDPQEPEDADEEGREEVPGQKAVELDAFQGLDPVELPITDILDLHSFRPSEVADVVREYLDTAYEKGMRHLRIIHGRGIGVQRRTVRTLLERDPRVIEFGDAPVEAGGWGATWIRLR
jgi:DNA-nicking Smr family endonuclease